MSLAKHFFIFLLWSLVIAFGSLYIAQKFPYTYPHNDFYVYWIAGKLITQNQSLYGVTPAFKALKDAYHLDFHWSTGYVYPPFFATLLIPLTNIEPHLAAWLWFTLNSLLYAFIAAFLTKKFPHRYTLPFILTFCPAIYGLASGQTVIITLGLWLIYLYSHSSWLQGLTLALFGQLKVYPLALVLLKKNLAISLFVVLFSLLVLPLPHTKTYLLNILPTLQQNTDDYFTHQSLNSFLFRLNLSPTFLAPIGMLIFLIAYSFLSKKSWFLKNQIWFLGLSLIAGRQTLWNYLPVLISFLYLLTRFKHLNLIQKTGFVLATLITNLVWHVLPAILTATTNPLISSIGFFAMLSVWLILLTFTESTYNHQS
jgi:hypothetical protein